MPDYAIGSDGNVTLPSGFNARIRSWSCNISRATSDISGFTQAGRNRRASSVVDITGSAGGVPQYYDGSGGGGAGTFTPIPNVGDDGDGPLDDVATLASASQITLEVAASTTIAFNCVFSGYAFSVSQGGDSTLTFNFEMNDGNGPTVTWDQS